VLLDLETVEKLRESVEARRGIHFGEKELHG